MKLLVALVVSAFLVSLIPIDVEAQKGWKTYTVPDEYSFQYPPKWEHHERENRFSTTDAIVTYGQFNDVRMMFEGGNKSEFGLSGSDNELIDSMGTFITENYDDGSLYENDSNKYIINNQTAPYVIGTYTGAWSTELATGETTPIDWVVMLVAVHLNEDQIVLVRYTTEMNDFDRYLPKVEQVFKSISPVSPVA